MSKPVLTPVTLSDDLDRLQAMLTFLNEEEDRVGRWDAGPQRLLAEAFIKRQPKAFAIHLLAKIAVRLGEAE